MAKMGLESEKMGKSWGDKKKSASHTLKQSPRHVSLSSTTSRRCTSLLSALGNLWGSMYFEMATKRCLREGWCCLQVASLGSLPG